MRKEGRLFGRKRRVPLREMARKSFSPGTDREGRGKAKRRYGLLAMVERKREKAAEELESSLRNMEMLAEALRDPEVLLRCLCHEDDWLRFRALRVLTTLAERGMDISEMMPQLVAGLTDRDPLFRGYCGLALAYSARNGAGISRGIRTLGAVLKKDSNQTVRAAVSFALCVAGENGADLSVAREALVAASADRDPRVRRFASDALFCIRPI